MNLFDDTMIQDTIQSISEPIIMNPNSDNTYQINGFLSNATLSSNSSYHLHSLDKISRGDILTFDDENYYIVIDDVIMKRGCKYKATVQYCNYKNIIIETVREIVGYDDFGRPIYNYVEKVVANTVGFIRHKTQTESSGALIVATSELILTVQDNEINRTSHSINSELEFEGKMWKVREQILTKKGLLELRLNSTT